MVKRVLSGAAEKRTPRWSIDPGNKANLGETRTAEVERFEKAPATTFPHGPAAVELPPNCHGGGPPNQRWRLTARLHESGRPGSNRRRPAWEAFSALAGQGFFGGGSRNGITQYADVGVGFGNFTFAPDAGLDVPARARTHARHPSADVRKRFEVDAEARGELEPGRARAVGDREGADDVVNPLELSVENVQDLRHALPPALE